MLQVFQFVRCVWSQRRYLVFRGIQPNQMLEFGGNGDVGDTIGAQVQIPDLLVGKQDWKQSFKFFFCEVKLSVRHRPVIGYLSQSCECSLQGFFQFFEVLFCLDASLLLDLLPFLFLQAFLFLLLFEFLLDLFGSFLGWHFRGLFRHYEVVLFDSQSVTKTYLDLESIILLVRIIEDIWERVICQFYSLATADILKNSQSVLNYCFVVGCLKDHSRPHASPQRKYSQKQKVQCLRIRIKLWNCNKL